MPEEDPDTSGTQNPMQVVIVEEFSNKTGGHYQAQSFKITVDQDGENFKTITFPIPISMLAAKWQNKSMHDDDEVELVVGDGTVIGAITANAAVDDTVLTVSQTVIDNTSIGYYLSINGQECGRVLSIDAENSQVTMETPVASAENAGATITQCVKLFPRGFLPDEGRVDLGDSKIGGSYIPANTEIKAKYWRKNSGNATKFIFFMEYLY